MLDTTAFDASSEAEQIRSLVEFGQHAYRRSNGLEWLAEFEERCDVLAPGLTIDVLRTACSDLAWWVRGRRDDDDATMRGREPTGDRAARTLAGNLLVGQLLRYDYRFGALRDLLRDVPDDDALIAALETFARLGLHGTVDPAEIASLRARRDCDVKALHCLMHGLCLAKDAPAHADLVIDIGDELRRRIATPDPVLEYRIAMGHRLRGDLDRAAEHLLQALSLPPPDNSVHQQFTAELQLVRAAQSFRQEIDRHSAAFAAEVGEVRRDTLGEIDDALRSGLTANFQILAIFLTLAGFLGTAGVVVVRLAESDITWQRGVTTLSILVGFTFLVLFGSRVLMSARLGRRRRPG